MAAASSPSASALSILRESHSDPSKISVFTNTSFYTNNPRFPKPLKPPSSITASTANHSATPIPYTNLKQRLRNKETLYGAFLLTFSPTLAEIVGLAGYDFAVVDMEHGHGSIADALPCLHALAATGTAAVLRLPESSAAWAKKALDLGPQGIMFPMIDGPKSARKAVSYCLFPPRGVRGSAHPIVRASAYGIDEGYLSNYEEELLIMCQVECAEGVDKIDEISAVDGVDCIQMGPLDLSASMGYLWDPGNKKVREAMREAEQAVIKGGKSYLSGFAVAHDAPEQMVRRGYHMVAGATDVGLFRTAAVEDVGKFRAMSSKDGDGEDKDSVRGRGEEDDEKYWSE